MGTSLIAQNLFVKCLKKEFLQELFSTAAAFANFENQGEYNWELWFIKTLQEKGGLQI